MHPAWVVDEVLDDYIGDPPARQMRGDEGTVRVGDLAESEARTERHHLVAGDEDTDPGQARYGHRGHADEREGTEHSGRDRRSLIGHDEPGREFLAGAANIGAHCHRARYFHGAVSNEAGQLLPHDRVGAGRQEAARENPGKPTMG